MMNIKSEHGVPGIAHFYTMQSIVDVRLRFSQNRMNETTATTTKLLMFIVSADVSVRLLIWIKRILSQDWWQRMNGAQNAIPLISLRKINLKTDLSDMLTCKSRSFVRSVLVVCTLLSGLIEFRCHRKSLTISQIERFCADNGSVSLEHITVRFRIELFFVWNPAAQSK